MSTNTLRARIYPAPSPDGWTGLSLHPPSDEEREYGRWLIEGYLVLRKERSKPPAINTPEGHLAAKKGMPEPPALNTPVAAPPKRRDRGLWRRVRSFTNLRSGEDGEGKRKGKQSQIDVQVDDELPPVPAVPAKWAAMATSPDPDEMMTFQEILDAGGRIDS